MSASAPETEPAEFTIDASETAEIVEVRSEAADQTASPDAAVHELDLSEEWAALATELEANASETNEAPPEAGPAHEFAVPAAETPELDEVVEIEDLLKAEAAGPSSGNGNEPSADYVLELETEQSANEAVAKSAGYGAGLLRRALQRHGRRAAYARAGTSGEEQLA